MKPLIVGNWKMNPSTQQEALELFERVKNGVQDVENAQVIICPPFVYISNFKFQISNLSLGAQNVFYKEEGAFTGEVSPRMLKDLGVKYVIIGHSDVRKNAGETNEIINKKITECVHEALCVILCVGEHEGEDKVRVLDAQITQGLRGLSGFKLQMADIIIAYEPVWAIGTGNNCSAEEVAATTVVIKKMLAKLYDSTIAGKIKILYGGSVNAKNSADYLKNGGVDGLLIGGASLNAREFTNIVKSVE